MPIPGSMVRRTTSLRMVEEPRVHKDDTVTHELVQENWAVIFGRIETRQELRPHRTRPGDRNEDWGNGFGMNNAAPAELIYSPENEFFIEDNPSKN